MLSTFDYDARMPPLNLRSEFESSNLKSQSTHTSRSAFESTMDHRNNTEYEDSHDVGMSDTPPLAPAKEPPKQFSTVPSSSFYSTKSETSSRWKSKLEAFRKAHERQQNGGRDGFFVWKVFSTQERAFRYADGRRNEGFAVFALENERTTNGRRRYLVCRKDDFWDRYRRMEKDQRHFYEIIREGTPCHLYFDLEFNRDINFLRDGPAMVRSFISFVLARLKRTFSSVATEADVVQLDSSTDSKFSRHLIFRLPRAAWRNNAHAGDFVRDLCLSLEEESSNLSPDEAALLSPVVKDDKGHDVLFVDQSVYSKNRNFRLVFSSKVGKKACFEVAAENRFPLPPSDTLAFLLDTMAGYVVHTPGLRILEYYSNQPKRRGLSLVARSHSATDDNRVLDVRSPFPDIDDWVAREIAARPGGRGRIKSALYFPDAGTIVYAIDGNRFCDVIQREHKSNGTYCYVKLGVGQLFFKWWVDYSAARIAIDHFPFQIVTTRIVVEGDPRWIYPFCC